MWTSTGRGKGPRPLKPATHLDGGEGAMSRVSRLPRYLERCAEEKPDDCPDRAR